MLSYLYPQMRMNTRTVDASMRYRIHDGDLLKRLMKHPGSDGAVHTVRSLAKVAGVSWSKIHRLTTGTRPTLTRAQADSIAAAVGVRRASLFSPSTSASTDADEESRK
ncbi:hypothetical protein AMK19_23350 [Kitasatospora sp. CB01950]|nr:hypothetical protein AMK19_23350 [Kitasatospora sp. CB01950]